MQPTETLGGGGGGGFSFCPALMLGKKNKNYIVTYATPKQVHLSNQLFYYKTYQAMFPLGDLRFSALL